jgi:lysozyme
MLPGIDISHYQGVADWPKVKQAGIRFAYIKATQGASFTDPKLKANVEGAASVEIPIGLYHVFLANTGEAQVQNWLNANRNFRSQLPSWLDIEPGSVTDETVCQVIDLLEKGFSFSDVIFCSPSTADAYLSDHTAFAAYGLAISHYNVSAPRIPEPWTDWEFWQHSCGGTVDGISTAVDLDWFHGDNSSLQALLNVT